MNIEDIRRNINTTSHSADSSFRTSAPIVTEEVTKKLFASVEDLEKVKESILSYKKDYSKEFTDLTEKIDGTIFKLQKISSLIDDLMPKIEDKINLIQTIEDDNTIRINYNDGGNYIEETLEFFMKENEIEKTIGITVDRRKREIVLDYYSQYLNGDIFYIFEDIKTYFGEVAIENLRKIKFNFDYYKRIPTTSTSEDYEINSLEVDPSWSVKTVEGKDSNNNILLNIFKIDNQKYNRLKSITKGNDVVDLIVANDINGIDVIQTTGRGYNFKRNPHNNEPIFPFIIKSGNTINNEIFETKASFDDTRTGSKYECKVIGSPTVMPENSDPTSQPVDLLDHKDAFIQLHPFEYFSLEDLNTSCLAYLHMGYPFSYNNTYERLNIIDKETMSKLSVDIDTYPGGVSIMLEEMN